MKVTKRSFDVTPRSKYQESKGHPWSPCASNLVQFRLLFTKLRHFEKNGTRHFSLIGRHLESVSRTIPIRHTSGISGGFRQLRIYDSAVMANFGTFVMRLKEDTTRDKLIPRKLVRQSRGDTKDEDVICHHSAHCRQILSIKTPLSSPSNSRII